MVGLRTSAAALLLALCALALLASLAAIQPAKARTSEEFAFRIAARLNPNGTQLEFGIQRIDDQGQPRKLHLEYYRFLSLDIDHHRWQRGDPSALRVAPYYDENPSFANAAKVRVVARLHPTRGRFQFGAQYQLDSSQLSGSNVDDYAPIALDRKQFFPDDIDHHRWLYSGVIRFTRVWSGDGTMDPEPTLHGDDNAPAIEPSAAMTTNACLRAWDPGTEAMYPDECDGQMTTYCAGDPDHPSCINWRENRW
ncbi:MAG: hypothetical protein OXG27_06780 [Chloroflexi bacterium]|nr:hypothetical protein [Chloroflexota bacterium]